MDLALVKFVGAGLSTLAPSLGVTVPSGAIAAGDKLVIYLLDAHPQAMRGIIEGVVRDITVDWRRSGLPLADAELHLNILPQLMDDMRPPADLMLGAYAVSKSGAKLGRSGVVVPARKVASAYIIKARETKVFIASELNESIAFFLLERLFVQLLLSRGWVDQLVPSFDDFFYKSLWRTNKPVAEPMPEPRVQPQPSVPVATVIAAPRPTAPYIPAPTPPQTSAVALRRSISSFQREEPKAKPIVAPVAAAAPVREAVRAAPKIEPAVEKPVPAKAAAVASPKPVEPVMSAQIVAEIEQTAATGELQSVPASVESATARAPKERALNAPTVSVRPPAAPRDGLVNNIARAFSWLPRATRPEAEVPAVAAVAIPVVTVAEPDEPERPIDTDTAPKSKDEPTAILDAALEPIEAPLMQVESAPVVADERALAPALVLEPEIEIPAEPAKIAIAPLVEAAPKAVAWHTPQAAFAPERAPQRPVNDYRDIISAIELAGISSIEPLVPATRAAPVVAVAPFQPVAVIVPEPAVVVSPAPVAVVEADAFSDDEVAEPQIIDEPVAVIAEAEPNPELDLDLDQEFDEPVIDVAPSPRIQISDLDLNIEELTMLPAVACAALRMELNVRLGEDVVNRDLLVRHVDMLIAVVQGMRPNAGLMSRSIELREAAIEDLLAGDIAQCEDWLLEAEEEELAAAEADPNVARLHRGHATQIRVAVAEIEEACGDFRRAAGHLGAAERNMLPTDRLNRWKLLLRQAQTLLRDRTAMQDGAVISDAIAAYRRALSVAGPRDTPSDWANVHREVAKLLIAQSEIENSDEALHASLEHLNHALEAYSRARASDEWAETLVMRGMVLSLLAAATKDRTQLLIAAEAFRAALGPLSQERTPRAWAAARAQLGLVLKRLAEIDKTETYLPEAVTNLRAVIESDVDLSAANGLTLVDLVAEFGEAAQMLALNRDDPSALISGAAVLAEAGPRLQDQAERLRVAEVVDQLGGCIWRIGGKRQDADMLSKAAKVKQAAISEFETLGEHDRVHDLKAELERLHDFMLTVIEQNRLKPRDAARTG